MFFNTIDKKANNILSKFHFISIFFLRVSLGIAFIIYGYSKFPLPPQKLMEYFNFSPFLASFVAVSELLAGILIILGGFLNFTNKSIKNLVKKIINELMKSKNCTIFKNTNFIFANHNNTFFGLWRCRFFMRQIHC